MGPQKKSDINKLERLQRNAASFILSRYKRADSLTDMHANLPTLSARPSVAKLKFLLLVTNGTPNSACVDVSNLAYHKQLQEALFDASIFSI